MAAGVVGSLGIMGETCPFNITSWGRHYKLSLMISNIQSCIINFVSTRRVLIYNNDNQFTVIVLGMPQSVLSVAVYFPI